MNALMMPAPGSYLSASIVKMRIILAAKVPIAAIIPTYPT
jgi:hypothetical protein